MRPTTEAELNYQDALNKRREYVRRYAKNLNHPEMLKILKDNIEQLDRNVIPELKKEIDRTQKDYYKSPEGRRQAFLTGGYLLSGLTVILAALAYMDKDYALSILYIVGAPIMAVSARTLYYYSKQKEGL